jgi:hypothetical protein
VRTKKIRTVTLRAFSGRIKELAQNTIGGGKVNYFFEEMVQIMNYIVKIIFQSNMKYI